MPTLATENTLADRVTMHWNTQGRIHPEVLGMRQDKLRELIHSIRDDHYELIAELRALLR